MTLASSSSKFESVGTSFTVKTYVPGSSTVPSAGEYVRVPGTLGRALS